MSTQKTAILLYCYSVFLLLCGICYLVFVDISVSIAMIGAFIGGSICGVVGYFMNKKVGWAFWLGLILSVIYVFLYGWLSAVEAHHLVDMLQNGEMYLEPYNALHQQTNLILLNLTIFMMTLVLAFNQFVRSAANGRELSS